MYKKFGKRFFDIIFSALGLIILGVIFIPVALLIYMEDKGPIFYNAERLGKDGKIFKMYKFRSMKVNAPDIRLKDGSTYNGEDDPRVTKVGRFIRKTSLDEVPQFINIFKGDMSLIGPRPDPIDWLERYPEEYKGFLMIRPGVTGYSQAYYRNSADGLEKMKNDFYYKENYNFLMDIKIFFKTIINVVKSENMYKDLSDEKLDIECDSLNEVKE